MSSITPPPPTRETLLRTASAFVQSYNTQSTSSILSIRTPTCIHHTLPLSLSIPSRNNTELSLFLPSMFQIITSVNFKIIDEKETVVDVEKKMVVVHCWNEAETVVGRYENEYSIRLRMSGDGELVEEIWEWADGERMRDLQGRIGKYLKEKGGEEGGKD